MRGRVVRNDLESTPIATRLIADDPRFEPDRSKERFILQNTLEGCLRRVR